MNVYFTTLFDLYALTSDFPGCDTNVLNTANPTPYVQALEAAFRQNIDLFRFIPYLQLYEYETLLFADPEAFRIAFENCDAAMEQLTRIAGSVPSLEHIDDGKDSAPSKRIIALIPEYAGEKAVAGPDIAEYIGIVSIREKCPHFNQWLTQLETINWEAE